jgi:drug/metabolite transporter (DMT)-like permease
MRRGYLALITLALIWGAAFLFIKLAVRDVSPATLVFARSFFGALTLGVIFAVRRQTPFPPGTRSRMLPFLYLGVAIGFLGTGILIAPDLIGQPLRATTIGALAVAGAACSYAVAALVQRRRLRGVSPLQVGFWQLALTAPLALALALPTMGATHLHVASIAAMLFLGVGGSGIAFLLYYFMMNTLGATRATTVTFLLPVTAVFWGASLLREAITISILAGMVVILLGVFLTSRPRRPAAVTADRGVA